MEEQYMGIKLTGKPEVRSTEGTTDQLLPSEDRVSHPAEIVYTTPLQGKSSPSSCLDFSAQPVRAARAQSRACPGLHPAPSPAPPGQLAPPTPRLSTLDPRPPTQSMLSRIANSRRLLRDFWPRLNTGMMGDSVSKIVRREDALPGRREPLKVAVKHHVNGNRTVEPFPEGTQMALFGMGCFWGAERKFWNLTGVYSTQVGFAGGYTSNPTYKEVCSGRKILLSG
ncbi:mitochondrial peptide methionine sulfoxide reductase [Petaurus breviceps papuanus]|uniref:mitochondrial peptide methionine sulfoxide reductase n=1 Tax=Petaurus breviceps papuanus TaxID=3040969 RepID=UPI0036DD2F95